jgi:hypothetical protein
MKRGDAIENPAELFTRISHAPSGLPPYMGFRHGALWPQCINERNVSGIHFLV